MSTHNHNHDHDHNHNHDHDHDNIDYQHLGNKHSHSHSHNHGNHHHHHNVSGKNLAISVVLNLSITIVQIIGGILSNSLSLLSDALHNLSDGIALWLALVAEKLSNKDANNLRTFGYKRAQIISAFINSFILLFICAYLFYEAYHRIINPEVVDGKLLVFVAIFGLLANLISVILLHKDKDENINIRSAYLHLLGDTLSSVAVIIGGIFIIYFDWYLIDPILTILIGLYIIRETYFVFWETINILMQTKPSNIDMNEIVKEINNFETIKNVHHIHLWNLDDKDIHFECHLDLNEDLKLSQIDIIRKEIEDMLHHKFEINHITIQVEFNCCNEKQLIVNH
ncbi:MAG: cation diffusion facilitator family transporter [Candidatus Kapaibacteriota bacterium]